MTIQHLLARFARDERGQALFEAVFFAPIVIFGMVAVIYFSQLGVLSERSENALRYGNDVSYRNGNSAYSVAAASALIDELESPGTPTQLGPLCLQNSNPSPNATPTDSQIQHDIKETLVNGESPTEQAMPTAKPYWQPKTVAVSPCSPGTVALTPASSTGAQGQSSASNGGLPLSTAGLAISSTIAMPVGLGLLFGSGSINNETSAHMTFVNVATPNVLLACVPALYASAQVLDPSATPSQLDGYCPGAPGSTSN